MFEDCSSVVLYAVWEGYAFCFVLCPLDCFSNSGSCMFPCKFYDHWFYFCEKCAREFDRDCMKSVDFFG